ncbi:unnamed protein product [Orchesella dallaii]|uniref:Uncharacterized protein n=1 Tax=Orchesella dallaii TaxID=48710 RepID=A0ABP1RQ90_9HEXA
MNSKIVLGFIAVAAIVEASAAPQEELEVPRLLLLPPTYQYIPTLCEIGDDGCQQRIKHKDAAGRKAYVAEVDEWIATLDGPSKATWEQDYPEVSQNYRSFSG